MSNLMVNSSSIITKYSVSKNLFPCVISISIDLNVCVTDKYITEIKIMITLDLTTLNDSHVYNLHALILQV